MNLLFVLQVEFGPTGQNVGNWRLVMWNNCVHDQIDKVNVFFRKRSAFLKLSIVLPTIQKYQTAIAVWKRKQQITEYASLYYATHYFPKWP